MSGLVMSGRMNRQQFELAFGWNSDKQAAARSKNKMPYYKIYGDIFYFEREIDNWIKTCGEKFNQKEK